MYQYKGGLDVPPFKIMKMTFSLQFLFVPRLLTFCVERPTNNLCVVGTNLAPVLLILFFFIFFVEFYKCIFGANVTDFQIFKT